MTQAEAQDRLDFWADFIRSCAEWDAECKSMLQELGYNLDRVDFDAALCDALCRTNLTPREILEGQTPGQVIAQLRACHSREMSRPERKLLGRLERALQEACERRIEQPAPLRGDTPPPKGAVKAALEIIRAKKGRGLKGKSIVAELSRVGFHIEESTFRRRYVAELKAHGVENNRARGGYYDARACPTCM
jgi:hypothetical protein